MKIERLRDRMTGCKWMAVIPQLISRICHKEPTVYRILSVRGCEACRRVLLHICLICCAVRWPLTRTSWAAFCGRIRTKRCGACSALRTRQVCVCAPLNGCGSPTLWAVIAGVMLLSLLLLLLAVPLRKSRAEKLINTVKRAKDEKKPLLDAAQFLFSDLIRVAKHQPSNGSSRPYDVRRVL